MNEQALYTDGGVILRNPSSIGGTWAWCLVDVDGGEIIKSGSGVITVVKDELITNNLMEYFAALQGLRALPDEWEGDLYSDSQVTLGRIFEGWRLNGIPLEWVALVEEALQHLGEINPVPLQGHPTKADLERGIGAKRNLPVSKWNKWCDEECQRQAKEYLEKMKG